MSTTTDLALYVPPPVEDSAVSDQHAPCSHQHAVSPYLAPPSSWHIPDIKAPGYPLPKVPCFCEPGDYDGQGFVDFPARVGWKLEFPAGPVYTGPPNSPLSDVKAFLQAWLFFGFIHEASLIFGIEIDITELAAPGEVRTLTTWPLREYFGKVRVKAEGMTRDERFEAHNQLADLLRHVDLPFKRYVESVIPGVWKMLDFLPLDTVMLVLIVWESLNNLARLTLVLPRGWDTPLNKVSVFHFQTPLFQRMVEEGWCPSTVNMLHSSLDHTGVFIASRLKLLNNSASHDTCTTIQCWAGQVDEKTYRTKHTPDCKGCSHISVDNNELANILRQGGIPLIAISVSAEEEISLKVVESSQYVSISHVWSHGLGNAVENSLPRCQLLKIKKIVLGLHPFDSSHISADLAIWIDTLCIPVSNNLKAFRKIAITRLPQTYQDAEHVLVIDADLISASRFTSRIEKITRVLCSTWMRRLWTFQEAVIAKRHTNCEKLQLQFSDGAITFHSLFASSGSLCHTEKALNLILVSLPVSNSAAFKFSMFARALRFRSTSKLEDEALCLTAILGGNIAAVVRAKTADTRMKVFYSNIEEVYPDIIFRDAEKLAIDGYRWAPRSFLGASASLGEVAFQYGAAKRDCEGLYVTYAALVIRQVKPPAGEGLHFRYKVPSYGKVQLLRPPLGKMCTSPEMWIEEGQRCKEFDDILLSGQELVVLLNSKVNELHVIAAVLRDAEGIWYCRYLAQARITNDLPESVDPRYHSRGVLDVERIPVGDRTWCIG